MVSSTTVTTLDDQDIAARNMDYNWVNEEHMAVFQQVSKKNK